MILPLRVRSRAEDAGPAKEEGVDRMGETFDWTVSAGEVGHGDDRA
jgi:hypothetical protein